MPKPPRETMGGFVDTMLSFERQKVDSEISIVKSLTETREFLEYDQDFKDYIQKRLKFMEEYKTRLESIEPIIN